MGKLRHYYNLTKPGIVYSNTFAVIAGFFLATNVAAPHLSVFLSVVIGTALVIASACVINNYIDRNVDAKMERTKKRELPAGILTVRSAVVFGGLLGVIGFLLLLIGTNLLTLILGAIAYVFYVVIYGYFKRVSEHGTLVGSIAGALPPVAGYTALTNRFDLGAVLLFALMVAWQMAHFYSIAIYRREDYKKAGIPLLTVTRGVRPAKEQITLYIIAFIVVAFDFYFAGYVGVIALIVLLLTGGWWLVLALRLLRAHGATNEVKRARKLFFFSLLVLFIMCLAVAGGGYLV